MAEAGFDLALVPASIAEELAAGALATIHAADLEAAQDLVAVTRRDGFLSAAARRLLELARKSYGDQSSPRAAEREVVRIRA